MLDDYGELRYCLRSIAKHLKNVGEIYLLGNVMPTWGANMNQIRVGDKEGKEYHEWNIYNKIKVATLIPEISNDFLFMNDDHYLLQDFDADFFPYFYEGIIKDGYRDREFSYQHTRKNTGAVIGHDAKFFDVHCPIRYNKTLFEKVTRYDWKKDYGYLIKSLYCAANNIGGTPCEDAKINSVESDFYLKNHRLKDKKFFSTHDNCFDEGGALLQIMDELYPMKSKWEK